MAPCRTINLYLTCAGGGLIASCVVMGHSESTGATALIAAAIMAPAFEPLACVGLSIVERHDRQLIRALSSAVASYAILIAVAVVLMLALRAGGSGFAGDIERNYLRHEIDH